MFRAASLLVLCAALTPLVARQDDDKVKVKLDAAKASYEAAYSDYRQAVGAWFDKRDESARKDGNKKLVDVIKTERLTFDERGELPKATPKTLRDQLAAARGKMEAGYRDAMKAYTKARMDAEAAAVEKELKTFMKPAATGPATAAAKGLPRISTLVLQRKLAGRATYNEKTGVLSLTYPFTSKNELKDFEVSDPPPTIIAPGGAVLLQPADTAKHIVRFDTMTLTGVLGARKPKGKLLSTSEGASVSFDQALSVLHFNTANDEEQQLHVPFRNVSTNFRLGLIIAENKATVQYGADQIGHGTSKPSAGHLTLHGGDTGHAFGHLTISGKLNPEWAAAFFAE